MSSYTDIINKRKKDWECDNLMDIASNSGEKIPFSSPLLNYSTYGGIPRNQITEFYGHPGGGKTSTAIDICKNACEIFDREYSEKVSDLREKASSGDKKASLALDELEEIGPKRVLYLDLENSFDAEWSNTLGIDLNRIDIMQPPNIVAEELLQTIQDLVETGQLGLVVLDSIPSLVTKQEVEKKLGERTVSALAGLLTTFFRKIVPILKRYSTTLVLINQLRDNMDNPYVMNTPGGQALKFYCSLRILFKIGSPVDFVGNELPASAENPAGYKITAKITKQKSAPWDRRNGSYYLMAKSGIRIDMDYCQLAINKYKILSKAGAWIAVLDPYTLEPVLDSTGKPVKVNGVVRALEYLQNNPEYFEKLQKYIIDDIEGNGITE